MASGSGVEVPDWLEHLSAGVDRAIEEAEVGGLDADGERPLLPAAVAEVLGWEQLPWNELLAAVSRKGQA